MTDELAKKDSIVQAQGSNINDLVEQVERQQQLVQEAIRVVNSLKQKSPQPNSAADIQQPGSVAAQATPTSGPGTQDSAPPQIPRRRHERSLTHGEFSRRQPGTGSAMSRQLSASDRDNWPMKDTESSSIEAASPAMTFSSTAAALASSAEGTPEGPYFDRFPQHTQSMMFEGRRITDLDLTGPPTLSPLTRRNLIAAAEEIRRHVEVPEQPVAEVAQQHERQGHSEQMPTVSWSAEGSSSESSMHVNQHHSSSPDYFANNNRMPRHDSQTTIGPPQYQQVVRSTTGGDLGSSSGNSSNRRTTSHGSLLDNGAREDGRMKKLKNMMPWKGKGAA